MIHTPTCITRITVVGEWQELLPACPRLSWRTEAEPCYFPPILMRGILRRTAGVRGPAVLRGKNNEIL